MDSAAQLNPRAGVGGNNPPLDVRTSIAAAIMAAQDEAARILAEHPAFETDEVLASAGKIKRASEALGKQAEAARKAEKKPHDDAGKEVQTYWLPLITRMDAAAAELEKKMSAELVRRKAEKDAAERVARDEADRLAKAAEKASEAAFDALDKVSTGEVSDANHLEAKQAAIEAHEAAKAAESIANRIGRETAGVKVDGHATISITVSRKVRLAFPKDGARADRAMALLDFMECVMHTPSKTDMTDFMLKIANRIYREMKVVPPHCEEYDENNVR